mgnify:CR=1 FL=1
MVQEFLISEVLDAQESKRDSRIKYECNAQNLGAAVTRNNALRRAKGRWIAFWDSDDLWEPEKLEKQLRFISNSRIFKFREMTFNNKGTPLPRAYKQ